METTPLEIQEIEQQNEDFPREVEEESEEIRQKIEELRLRREPINIVVFGPTGVGKSTLINNMMGDEVAKVSHGIGSEQSQVEVHEGEHKGVKIKVYDTVGFGDSRRKSNSDIFNEINAQGNFDLVLLCIAIDRRADKHLDELLDDVKSNLRVELWKHLVVVFTFTNRLIDQDTIKKLPEFQKEPAVKEKIKEFKEYIYTCVSGCVDRDTFEKIEFCTAGTGNQGQNVLLFDKNWLNQLWASCIDQCSERSHPFMMSFAEYLLGTFYSYFRGRNDQNLRGQEGQENLRGQENQGGQGNGWCTLI